VTGSRLPGVHAAPGGDPHAHQDTPRGQALPLAQKLANQALHHRRLRIAPVHSRVKRCRVVKGRIRLWKDGVRDLVMALCGALHNVRGRLALWQSMI
jgi:hypothetical protein